MFCLTFYLILIITLIIAGLGDMNLHWRLKAMLETCLKDSYSKTFIDRYNFVFCTSLSIHCIVLFFVFTVLLRSDSGFYTLNWIELNWHHLLCRGLKQWWGNHSRDAVDGLVVNLLSSTLYWTRHPSCQSDSRSLWRRHNGRPLKGNFHVMQAATTPHWTSQSRAFDVEKIHYGCQRSFVVSSTSFQNAISALITQYTRIIYSSLLVCTEPEVKGQGHTVQKPCQRTVASDYSGCPVTLCCAACGRCRRGSACRYDCLRFLVATVFTFHFW